MFSNKTSHGRLPHTLFLNTGLKRSLELKGTLTFRRDDVRTDVYRSQMEIGIDNRLLLVLFFREDKSVKCQIYASLGLYNYGKKFELKTSQTLSP